MTTISFQYFGKWVIVRDIDDAAASAVASGIIGAGGTVFMWDRNEGPSGDWKPYRIR